MISYKHKCIFIHITKCGGTTVDTFFRGKFFGHGKAIQYKTGDANYYKSLIGSGPITQYNNSAKVYDDFFKFTFVRNPWDRIVSLYSYHKQRNFDYYDFDSISFRNYVKKYLFTQKTQTPLNVNPCMDWITDENGNLIIDFIGRFENLQKDFDKICKHIGMNQQQLPHKNKSKHKHYTEYYDEETKEIVAEKYAKDIEYFGYKFGE